jgi:hypothetical protein
MGTFLIKAYAHSGQEMIEHSSFKKMESFQLEGPHYLNPDLIVADELKVKAHSVQGFNSQSQLKLKRAFDVLEVVLNSQEFKHRIVNFKNSQGEAKFASNAALSNEEIFMALMEGRETLQPDTPGEMNLYLKLYNNPFSRVIGWTSPQINTIHINWKYFRKYGPHEVAGNLAHEWAHKLGFDHRSASEHDSVPYAVGYIVIELGERYLRGEQIH